MPTKKKPLTPKQGAEKKPPKLDISKKRIEEIIQGVYDGTIGPNDIPEDLYLAIGEYLTNALYEGYGMTMADAEGSDLELIKQLRDNVYHFSAAKSYVEMKEFSSLLVDDDGKVLSFKEFRDLALQKYDVYNVSYLETEYSTAIGQAYSAQKWNDIEEKKEVLPILEYKAISDPCDICAPLDGLTAPVDDSIWASIAPLNHFNCKCILVQHDEEEKLTPDEKKQDMFVNAVGLMQPMFRSNPGQDGMIFNESHPYFEEAAKEKLDLKVPKKDK